MIPARPYLFRALIDWVVDNGWTPHVVVDATDPAAEVPAAFVQDGRITLNVAPSAVRDYVQDDQWLSFSARFAGTPHSIVVPMRAVLAVFARESRQGMVFGAEPGHEALMASAPSESRDRRAYAASRGATPAPAARKGFSVVPPRKQSVGEHEDAPDAAESSLVSEPSAAEDDRLAVRVRDLSSGKGTHGDAETDASRADHLQSTDAGRASRSLAQRDEQAGISRSRAEGARKATRRAGQKGRRTDLENKAELPSLTSGDKAAADGGPGESGVVAKDVGQSASAKADRTTPAVGSPLSGTAKPASSRLKRGRKPSVINDPSDSSDGAGESGSREISHADGERPGLRSTKAKTTGAMPRKSRSTEKVTSRRKTKNVVGQRESESVDRPTGVDSSSATASGASGAQGLLSSKRAARSDRRSSDRLQSADDGGGDDRCPPDTIESPGEPRPNPGSRGAGSKSGNGGTDSERSKAERRRSNFRVVK
ncbi:MAG: ClpXP protease specificity-enhancing factor [Thioalkalivibrionaceae bacterium]